MKLGHYTQMVWKSTNEIGCGIASGDGHPFSILECHYNPPGNMFGETPYQEKLSPLFEVPPIHFEPRPRAEFKF